MVLRFTSLEEFIIESPLPAFIGASCTSPSQSYPGTKGDLNSQYWVAGGVCTGVYFCVLGDHIVFSPPVAVVAVCNRGVDFCYAATLIRQGGTQVLEAVDLFKCCPFLSMSAFLSPSVLTLTLLLSSLLSSPREPEVRLCNQSVSTIEKLPPWR